MRYRKSGGSISFAVAREREGATCGGTWKRWNGQPGGRADRQRRHRRTTAQEAAYRGLVVGLVEKHDFGWGTTAASTRLIHGGLRYLESRSYFGLVREGLREREALLKLAPTSFWRLG